MILSKKLAKISQFFTFPQLWPLTNCNVHDMMSGHAGIWI